MEDNCVVLSSNSLPQTTIHKLNDMRLNCEQCDITIKIQERKISAHRAVLAAGIPYFSYMFSSKMRESYVEEITMKDTNFNALKSLIDFVYSCPLKISMKNVKPLLVCSQYLDMDVVYNACSMFLAHRLVPNNVLEIWGFARNYSVMKLADAAERYVEKNFVRVCDSDNFLHLTVSELKSLIAKDELHVPNEEFVFDVVMSWVKSSPGDRKDELPELLTLLRMPLLSSDYLSHCVASEDLIQNSSICRGLLDEAVNFQKGKRKVPSSFSVQPRCLLSLRCRSTDTLHVLCSAKGSSQLVFRCFDHQLGTWAQKDKPAYTSDSTVAVMGKNIYVIGGCSKKAVLNSVQVFDTEAGSWSLIPSMNKRRFKPAAASLSNKLYVCGGKTDTFGCPVNSAEYFDPVSEKWTDLPGMLMCHEQACAVAFCDQLYVLGRLFGGVAVTSFFCIYAEKYNPITNQWVYVPGMNPGPMGRAVSAIAQNNKIFVLSDSSVEIFDSRAGRWDKYCNTPKYSISATLFEFRGRLYIFEQGCQIPYIYDPEKGEWSKGVPLPEDVCFEGAGVVSTS